MAHDGLMQVRWSLALSFLLPAGLAALLEIGWSGADPHVQVLLVVGTGLLSTAVTWLVARQAHAAQSALLAEVGRREAVEAELRERTLSLGQREAFLTSLVDILSVEVFAVDPAGRPVLWNAASRNAFGVAAGPDGVPESWREEFRLLDLDGAEIPLGDQPLPRALRGESVPTREVMITVPGLPVRRVLMSAATIRMPDGGIVGGVLAGHDVSALRARERELERLVQDLDAIARAKTAVLSGTDARTAICQAAREITGATVASLMEPTADATALVLTRSSPAHSTDFRLPVQAPSRTVTAFRTGRVQVVHDTRTDALAHRGALDAVNGWASVQQQVRGVVCVPVRHERQVLGVLVVAMPEGIDASDPRLLALLEMLATDTALAIDRENLLLRLSGEALTDPLTGLPNRRAWDDALARELALARQQGRPLTVALLDLDRFKAFNDSQGHPAGDALLVGATRLWRDRLRSGDLLARLGGEEFGVLLYNCSLADGAVLVERLLGDLPSDQTCSAGLAELGDETARELLTRADQALYRAKAGGRARLALADPVPVLVRRPGQSPASAVRASPSTR